MSVRLLGALGRGSIAVPCVPLVNSATSTSRVSAVTPQNGLASMRQQVRFKGRLEAIKSVEAPKAIGPYSQAIKAVGWIFTSGAIPMDPQTNTVIQGDVQAQAHQVLKNLRAVLEDAGSNMEKVIKTTVYLTDMNDFAAMNEIYEQYFSKVKPPARSCVQVGRLPKDVKVEIECIALA